MEKAKASHTTHWDMDYLPRKDLDTLYRNVSGGAPGSSEQPPPSTKPGRRRGWVLAAAVVIPVILAAVWLLAGK